MTALADAECKASNRGSMPCLESCNCAPKSSLVVYLAKQPLKYSKYDISRSKFLHSPSTVLQGMIVLENELLEAKVGLERDVVL